MEGRFWVWNKDIWLDTQPDLPLTPLDQIPPALLPYLRLSDLGQHMPQPYFYMASPDVGGTAPVLLLEAAPIGVSVSATGQIEAFLLPALPQAWAGGSALQQLNWLRQIAALWPSFSQEQVAATLLQLETLRVDQALLRITTLTPDQNSPSPVTLRSLGQRWQPLAQLAQPAVQPYLIWLAQALAEGRLTTHPELLAELEQAIQTLGQGLSVGVDWVAETDQGPARDRNEDACYPQGQLYQRRLTRIPEATAPLPMVLVCDGIGGHEQGNVASNTAIKLMLEELQPLAELTDLSLGVVAQRLRRAITLANDAISARNNDEQRSARSRMGTTLVMGLVHFPYLSIAHLGDSRAYRISAQTCYQITLDDDVASREAHLGYALHQEAIQMPSGGALIQALGISDSGYLYPTVQHVLIDDSSIFLLCSDGLSDYDRVEALWPTRVKPLVGHPDRALQSLARELINEANRLNGHDNVTVGLLRFIPAGASWPTLPAAGLTKQFPDVARGKAQVNAGTGTQGTLMVTPASRVARPVAWKTLVGGATLALLALGGGLWAYRQRQPPPLALQALGTFWPLDALAGQPLPPLALAATAEVTLGSYWQVSTSSGSPTLREPLRLAPTVGNPGANSAAQGGTSPAASTAPLLPAGSILKVVGRQTTVDRNKWVRLQVCSIPSGASLSQAPQESGQPIPLAPPGPLQQRLSAPGDQGWALARQLYSTASALDSVTLTQAGDCVP